ncbi:MAG: signal peptidase I [Clostridiales bacterium]|nr:signal peptidase I [Clostridiales bacterium]
MKKRHSTGKTLFNEKESFIPPASIYFVIFLLVGFLIFFYFLSFIPISGNSMENTMFNHQYCLVQRKCFDVKRGDIVTINTAAKGEKDNLIIKRVIGMEGDQIIFMLSDDKYYVDLYIRKAGESHFKLKHEPYIKERMERNSANYYNVNLLKYNPQLTEIDFSTSYDSSFDDYIITVPKSHVYFLGDNRNISRDSRYYKTRNLSCVTSKVLLIF